MSPQEAVSLTRTEMFDLLKSHLNEEVKVSFGIVENYVSSKLGRPFCLSENVKKNVSYLLYRLRTLWKESRSTESAFKKKTLRG